MYRIRLHGRGGQGTKTASRVLGSALFCEGFEVQDAPRYGAERRGAPIFATVRADRSPIHERGVVRHPDLVLVADASLLGVPAAGVLQGLGPRTVLVLHDDEPAELWARRLGLTGLVLTLPTEADAHGEQRFVGARCAGAAARLLGVVGRAALEQAVREEIGPLGDDAVETSLARALAAWELFEGHAGCVAEGAEVDVAEEPLDWVEVPFEPARISAPDIHAAATSVEVRTGLWRTMRPVVELEHCHRCSWICTTFCPDGAIGADPSGAPRIDYDHCKGCLICVAVCPAHAIRAIPEREAAASEEAGAAR